MSKKRTIIALIAVLALLVAVYVYVEVAGVNEPETVATDRIRILELSVENIANMVLVSEDATLNIERVGDSWEVDYPYPINLDSRRIDDIAFSFQGLMAETVLDENIEDLSVFGLDEPTVEATVTLMDGTRHTVYLGNRTPLGNTFYLMKSGDTRVFTVWGSHGNHFSYTINDLRDTALTEINVEELTYFRLAREGERKIEVVQTEYAAEDRLQLGFARWHMVEPYTEYMSIHFERFNTLLANTPNMEITQFVSDNPEDLSDYGLDTPSMEIELRDAQNTLRLIFGDVFDESLIHFQVYGQNAIYAMDKTYVQAFFDAKPFDLLDRFSYIVMIDYVDRIEIEANEEKHILTLSRVTNEAEKEGEEDEVITSYAVNGQDVGEDEFKDFYQILIGLIVEAENNEALEGEPLVTTTFYLNRGAHPYVRIDYLPFNEDFLAVSRGGNEDFLISRKQVYRMLDYLRTLGE